MDGSRKLQDNEPSSATLKDAQGDETKDKVADEGRVGDKNL